MTVRVSSWVTLAALVIGTILGPQAASAAGERALWVWSGPSEAVIDFAATHGITDLYLHTPPGFSQQGTYGPFLDEAHARGLTVLAMAGDASWARDGAAWVAWTEEVVAHGKFDGVVFDVEPYALPEWSTKRRGRLIRSYLDGLKEASRSAGNLDVYAAIPFWWDQPEFRVGRDLLLDRVLDSVDAVVVMAYRDHASGPDGIIDLATTEAEHAATAGRGFVIGVETAPASLDKVSFAEEGAAAMEDELSQVTSHFASASGFGGIAVHHYEAYASLLP